MDPTLQAFLAALAGALVAGGAVLAWAISERQQAEAARVPPPVVPPGVGDVLAVLRSSAVVLNQDDVVLRASAPAYALGLIRGNEVVNDEILQAAAGVRRDGEIRDIEATVPRPGLPPHYVNARIAPLGSRLLLILLDDRTQARRVEAIRRDFVANVSHELKTPVGAIRVLADTMLDASDDPEAVQRFAARMRTESDRLTRLVTQIIDLSRLQDDDPVDDPARVQVDDVLRGAVETNLTEAEAKGVELAITGHRNLVVLGIADQLSVAVSNLVANAVAYSHPESTVAISARADDERGRIDIAVVDTGIGIPLAELDRIFERFYRVDPARHRSTGGTGLGLSIVKHIAATHGGEVRVWSAAGQGSTFTISLPAAPAPVASPDPLHLEIDDALASPTAPQEVL